jgi:5-formyltetrahydrofolate cyclo-ligase
MTETAELRRRLKRERAAIPAGRRRALNQALCGHLMNSSIYRDAGHLAAYVSAGGEPDLMPILRQAAAEGTHRLAVAARVECGGRTGV